ncbi:MAG: 50S ribosomal protein L21 [Spirochaetales bacterium]|nr:50S ribosomal protein L21 [Spirochaetales bacterium]
MYALVEIKGKQYKALEGAHLTVDKIDIEDGEVLEFDSVLMISDGDKTSVGTPYVKGAKVTALVNEQIKGKKLTILKFKRRKGYRKKQGHRQNYSVLTVQNIKAK